MTQQEFINRYTYNTKEDFIGGGTFGSVYKAYDNKLDKFVAIKIAEVKTFGNKTFSLLDEFDALKGLPDHQNIANYELVYTYNLPTGTHDFAVIQYYPYGNLSHLIKNETLSQEQKQDIALQLLNGLEFLHQNKVVHRDMKPFNILIHKRHNGRIIPKIADFGLSKKASPNAQSRFTNSFGGGTLEYSSPEQLKGHNLRFNTDLWAWAVIVYELFTGNMLFTPKGTYSTGSAEREKDLYEQILGKNLEQNLQELPEKWQKPLAKCLERNPEHRIKTATEVKALLTTKTNKTQPTTHNPKNTIVEHTTHNQQHKTNNQKPTTNNKKRALYIGLVVVLGSIGFLGAKWANNKTTTHNQELTTTINNDSIAFSQVNKTDKNALQEFINTHNNTAYNTLANRLLDSINKAEALQQRNNDIARKKKEAEKRKQEQEAKRIAREEEEIYKWVTSFYDYKTLSKQAVFNLTKLNLLTTNITKLPESIAKLTNLETLVLRDNKITALPESFSKLTNLTELNLDSNKITALPESISKLSHLTRLNLGGNNITALPESMTKLTKLYYLNLEGNKITVLPLPELTNLTQLNLSFNNITVLPESISKLTKLEQLWLDNNNITKIPELTNLRGLNLSNNNITVLPESISKLTNLTQLSLSFNNITAFPESITKLTNLKVLNLWENKITALPESMAKLTKLYYLKLSNNPITTEEKTAIKRFMPKSCQIDF